MVNRVPLLSFLPKTLHQPNRFSCEHKINSPFKMNLGKRFSPHGEMQTSPHVQNEGIVSWPSHCGLHLLEPHCLPPTHLCAIGLPLPLSQIASCHRAVQYQKEPTKRNQLNCTELQIWQALTSSTSSAQCLIWEVEGEILKADIKFPKGTKDVAKWFTNACLQFNYRFR